MKISYPVKLDADYPCRGTDADGRTVEYRDLLRPGDRVGAQVPGDPLNAFPPFGRVVSRDGGLFVDLA